MAPTVSDPKAATSAGPLLLDVPAYEVELRPLQAEQLVAASPVQRAVTMKARGVRFSRDPVGEMRAVLGLE
jgi:hypothetical protein